MRWIAAAVKTKVRAPERVTVQKTVTIKSLARTIHAYIRPMRTLAALTAFFGATAVAQDLTALHKQQHVRIAMVGQGSLCEGIIEGSTIETLALRLSSDTIECGSKGTIVTLSKTSVYAVSIERRLTKGRFVLKVLAGVGAVGALAIIPATSSDPESWLLLGNVGLPAIAAVGAAALVPKARQYVLLLTCPDRFHCFSHSP